MTKRELATVLAALRLYQQEEQEYREAMPHFEAEEPLTDAEIDDLCERLNGDGDEPDGRGRCDSCGERTAGPLDGTCTAYAVVAAFADLAPEISAQVDKDTMQVYDDLLHQAE